MRRSLLFVALAGCSNILGFQDPAGHRPDGGAVVIDATVLDDGHVVPRPDAPIPVIDAAPGTPDASPPDAPLPDAFVDTTIAKINDPCSDSGKLMCAGHAQTSYLVCDGTKYVYGNQCGPGTLCDSEVGANQGTCQPILSECTTPGLAICTGADREYCGPDRVTSIKTTCVSNAACLASTGPTCVECGDVADCFTPPTATKGMPFSFTAGPTSGTPPFAFGATGGTVPAGLSVSRDTGVLGGVPQGSGAVDVTITGIDKTGCAGSYELQTSVAGSTCPPITVSPSYLAPVINQYAGYNPSDYLSFSASAGTSPITFSVTEGGLPAGLVLGPSGSASGQVKYGTYQFTITATDANGCTGSTHYVQIVADSSARPICPTITVSGSVSGTGGRPFATVLSASGGTPPYAFGVQGLNEGLMFDGALLYGVPVADNNWFYVYAVDANGCVGMLQLNEPFGQIDSACTTPATLGPSTLPLATVGTTYSQKLTATGDAGPYTFTMTGSIPPGLSITGDTISGTPTTPGVYDFYVIASDSGSCGGQFYTLVVGASGCSIGLAPPASACTGHACTGGSCLTPNFVDGTLLANDLPGDCDQTSCQGGAPTKTLDAAENCGAGTSCTAVDTCTGGLGAFCDAPSGPSYSGPQASTFCASGICRDGVCCESDCNGTCDSCAGTGMCHAVTQVYDDSCPTGQACGASSTCQQALGSTCSSTGDCAWGSCLPTYLDYDKDNYGVASQPTGMRCVDTYYHNGNGYSDRTGDCCDSDYSANPGFYPSIDNYNSPDACGSWDRNCDGTLENFPPACPAPCPYDGNSYDSAADGYCFPSVPSCGASGWFNENYFDSSNCSLSYTYTNYATATNDCY